MPVEIKELIIRTTVDGQNKKSNTGAAEQSCSDPTPAETGQVQVDEVLKMIKNQNER
ncbi:DUF5908 family protein [Pseudozobellia thermophila]|uniref:Uncharacterized protein n=1 Tax=Pseudozobellia thermophila TaxID=192903 RepID=A0A1M6M6S4_9FLAO|nr:DUF5908 family protein [Pseudozobellia thermophila]SHJ79155.1 hypothetical protein SAMN04488513_10914 [Pseudozobellia thermophila]